MVLLKAACLFKKKNQKYRFQSVQFHSQLMLTYEEE